MPYDEIALEAEDKMEKAVAVLNKELRGVRTGRASPGLVDTIKVDYYGEPTQLKALASITVPEARMILVKPFDPGATDGIIKGIQKSDIGLTPQSDGKVIRLAVPPLSEERRKKMSKTVKDLGEKAKISMRSIRREGNSTADREEKEKDISEDDAKRIKTEMDRLTKEYEGKVVEALEKKTKEVMEI